MSILLNGDCNIELKEIDDESVDLIFCDLPYAVKGYSAVNCKWNTPVDLDLLWEHFMRIKKLHTPIFMTCNTKFGVDLIRSAPKNCPFRWDSVWVKSSSCSFLLARKMPMKKHEMLYCFYEKLPLYDLSSHTHKFIKNVDDKIRKGQVYDNTTTKKMSPQGVYNPPLPVSVLKEDKYERKNSIYPNRSKNGETSKTYEPPLPSSVIKEAEPCPETMDTIYGEIDIKKLDIKRKDRTTSYDPPLPTSVIKEDYKDNTRENKSGAYGDNIKLPESTGKAGAVWNPPLPTSVIKDDYIPPQTYGKNSNKDYNKEYSEKKGYNKNQVLYDPPLPTSVIKNNIEEVIVDNPYESYYIEHDDIPDSILEIRSTKGKHSTEKPVALISWILKYFSKEGDVVLDPTMGGGSCGVACREMNRNFIGIERDTEIYERAVDRIENE